MERSPAIPFANKLVSEDFQGTAGYMPQRKRPDGAAPIATIALHTPTSMEGTHPVHLADENSSSRHPSMPPHERCHGEHTVTPFQDCVALSAACISAAFLFASTPAQSTKSNTLLYQATAGAMPVRFSKDSKLTCAGAPRTSCANSANTDAGSRCILVDGQLFAPELPRLAARTPAPR